MSRLIERRPFSCPWCSRWVTSTISSLYMHWKYWSALISNVIPRFNPSRFHYPFEYQTRKRDTWDHRSSDVSIVTKSNRIHHIDFSIVLFQTIPDHKNFVERLDFRKVVRDFLQVINLPFMYVAFNDVRQTCYQALKRVVTYRARQN